MFRGSQTDDERGPLSILFFYYADLWQPEGSSSEHAQEADEGRRALLLIMIISGNNILAFVVQYFSIRLPFFPVFKLKYLGHAIRRLFQSPLSPPFPPSLEAAAAGSNHPWARKIFPKYQVGFCTKLISIRAICLPKIGQIVRSVFYIRKQSLCTLTLVRMALYM